MVWYLICNRAASSQSRELSYVSSSSSRERAARRESSQMYVYLEGKRRYLPLSAISAALLLLAVLPTICVVPITFMRSGMEKVLTYLCHKPSHKPE